MNSLLSKTTITVIGLSCKAFLNLGFCSLTVNGLPTLLDALASPQRRHGQGVLTVANHISTLDDPVMWGILPVRHITNPRSMRWALGASEVMFTNPLFSAFFRHGQVLETFRGKGVYQPAIDLSIRKLNGGEWVHVFPESKVHQPKTYPREDDVAHLPRFKWGFGRLMMEADIQPIVIPIWLAGFDQLMPEGREFPYNYIPRVGMHLSITFGEPIPAEDFGILLNSQPGSLCKRPEASNCTETIDNPELARIRSEVTAVAQHALEALGRRISGNLLGA